jgi:hypothetical protein
MSFIIIEEYEIVRAVGGRDLFLVWMLFVLVRQDRHAATGSCRGRISQ